MKVLIADEHALFRDGLGLLIEQLDGSATILQASNFAQALKILDTEHKFDLIIIDLDMQDMVWEKGFDAIRAKAGDARLVVISASENVHNQGKSGKRRQRLYYQAGGNQNIKQRAETDFGRRHLYSAGDARQKSGRYAGQRQGQDADQPAVAGAGAGCQRHVKQADRL